MIETIGLGHSYGPKVALSDLNLRVEPGEIVGLLGPNGAGKSTTVRILTGLLPPTVGRATIAGFDIVREGVPAKQQIGYVPEQPALYDALTAAEFLEVVAALHHLDPDHAQRVGEQLLALLGLAAARDQRLQAFSKGMKQRVVLAAALLHGPKVLILDEPLDGLDVQSARVVKELVRSLATQGCAILLCSHILEVVERLCTRLVVIDSGRQIAQGTPAEIAAAAGTASLEDAFARLTGVRDAAEVSLDILRALHRS